MCINNTIKTASTLDLTTMTHSNRTAAVLLARDERARRAAPVTLPKAPFPPD